MGRPARRAVRLVHARATRRTTTRGAADYPALFVTAGLNDPRVSYHEPAKWTAKLRDVRTNPDTPLLLRTEMGAGHAGPSGRYDAWRDEARVLSFLFASCARC